MAKKQEGNSGTQADGWGSGDAWAWSLVRRFIELTGLPALGICVAILYFAFVFYNDAKHVQASTQILYQKMESLEFVARIPVYPTFDAPKYKIKINTSQNGFQVMEPGNLVTSQTIDFATADDLIDYLRKTKF